MEDDDKPAPAKRHPIRRFARQLSRTRIVMIVLLLIAIPIFISLANKTVNQNAEAIRQGFGR